MKKFRLFAAGVAVGAFATTAIFWSFPGEVRKVATEEVIASVSNATLESRVKSWLDVMQESLERKDIETVSRMLQLPENRVDDLASALHRQRDLLITFSDVTIEPVGSDAAVANYLRTDRFTERNGKRVTLQTRVTQRFRLRDGVLVAEG